MKLLNNLIESGMLNEIKNTKREMQTRKYCIHLNVKDKYKRDFE